MMGSFRASPISRADRSCGRLDGPGSSIARSVPAPGRECVTALDTSALSLDSRRTGGAVAGGFTRCFFTGVATGWPGVALATTGPGLIFRSGSGVSAGPGTTGGLGIGLRAATVGFTVGTSSVASPDKNKNSNSPPNPNDTAQATSIGDTVSRRNMHWCRTSLTRETVSSPSFQPPAASST